MEKADNFSNIPGFSNYRVNEKGEVFSVITDRFLTGSVNPDGYLNFRLKCDNGTTKTIGLHRLMLISMSPRAGSEDLVSNHKDGDKGNNSLDNLEWATYTENAEHAGRFGLTSKCLPVVVKDVVTGKTEKYPSLLKCAKEIGISKDAVAYRIKTDGQRVFPEGKLYKLEKSTTPWVEKSTCERYGRSIAIFVKDVFTGTVTFYDKLSTFSKCSGISVSSVYQKLQDLSQPLFSKGFLVKRCTDTTPWREVHHPLEELELSTCKKIVVVFAKNGELMNTYLSASDCARSMNLSETVLNYRLHSNGKYFEQKSFCYFSMLTEKQRSFVTEMLRKILSN